MLLGHVVQRTQERLSRGVGGIESIPLSSERIPHQNLIRTTKGVTMDKLKKVICFIKPNNKYQKWFLTLIVPSMYLVIEARDNIDEIGGAIAWACVIGYFVFWGKETK